MPHARIIHAMHPDIADTSWRIDIRPLAAADHRHWLLLWQDYLASQQHALPDSATAHTWQLLMQRSQLQALVAIARPTSETATSPNDDHAANTPIGFAHYQFQASTWVPAGHCYLEDLFIAAPWRGRGVAQALIEAVYAAADRRGAGRVYWHTRADNAPALALYDRIADRVPVVQFARRADRQQR